MTANYTPPGIPASQLAAELGDAGSPAREVLDAAIGPVARGVSGRAYKTILGAIRNPGSGFAVINDAGHEPTFIDSVSNTTQGIIINHADIGVSKVGGLIIVPDETLTAAGFQAGASVGLTSTTIYVYKDPAPVTAYISYSGSAWVITGGDGVSSVGSLGGTNPGELAINHDVVSGFGVAITPRGSTYRVVLGNTGGLKTNQTFVSFIDSAGNVVTTPDANMKFTLVRHGRPRQLVDPNTLNTTTYPNSNFWIVGVMESSA